MNTAMCDYAEDVEALATQVAEACLSPIPEESSWISGHNLLEPDHFDELKYLRAENTSLHNKLGVSRTTEKQLRIMNVAVSDSLYKHKMRADTAEADLERLNTHTKEVETAFNRVRDRAMDIILSRTAEVDRLKKELDAMTKPQAVAVPKPKTLKEAVIARLLERGMTPYMV